jgi:hypothetical protein
MIEGLISTIGAEARVRMTDEIRGQLAAVPNGLRLMCNC